MTGQPREVDEVPVEEDMAGAEAMGKAEGDTEAIRILALEEPQTRKR